MQQSTVIFAALFIAFLVYITAKGELSKYIGFLTGKSSAASSNTPPSNSTVPNPPSLGTIEQQAEHLLSQNPALQINPIGQ